MAKIKEQYVRRSSSEARNLETAIEELQRRVARLESAVYGAVSQQNTSVERTERLLRHMDTWLADESGYDEETWPKVKAALEEDRLTKRSMEI